MAAYKLHRLWDCQWGSSLGHFRLSKEFCITSAKGKLPYMEVSDRLVVMLVVSC